MHYGSSYGKGGKDSPISAETSLYSSPQEKKKMLKTKIYYHIQSVKKNRFLLNWVLSMSNIMCICVERVLHKAHKIPHAGSRVNK